MDKKNEKSKPDLISPHGGYRNLKSYQTAEIIYDATAVFCDLFIDKRSRTYDQMVQAARSGKQNIAEGSMVSGTSKKSELKLIGIARASLEELLLDYHDFLRQRGLLLWEKSHPQAEAIRKLAWEKNRSYETYKTYVEAAIANLVRAYIMVKTHPVKRKVTLKGKSLSERKDGYAEWQLVEEG